MVPNIVPIVSLFLLYVIPSPPRPDHFMPVHLSGSNSDLISTFTAAAATTIATRFYSSTSSCLLVSVITAIFVSILSPVVASASSQKWSPRHVDTKMGVVQGYIVYPNGFDGVEVLLNLPYASPPLGNLRFMPPVSGSPWSGVRRSEKPAPVCPQVLPDIRNESDALKSMPRGRLIQLQRLLPHLKNQSEDCLYLNLYVPLKVAEGRIQEKLPILVFVHGEDYGWGAGHPYDPSMLVSYGNIIVVTLNYRLGILGWLNANSDSHFRLPYNFALLDQIAALQWIQENVALFGGDRFNVTLMGHGKGAVLVNWLMISSAVPTGLLFHRVILSSGSASSPLASDLSNGPELSKRFAQRVRCPPEPSSTMLECLREVPVRQFLDSELWSLFGPTGDGIVVKNEVPSDNLIMNKASHYPLLFGVVKVEALPSLSNHDASYGMENERRRELLRLFINKYYRFHRNEILAGAIHEYTDWEKPVQHPQNVREETLDALGDAQVVAPMTKVGDLHSQSSRSRAYAYVFEYQSKSSDYQQRLGCIHGEDLGYVFGVPLFFYDYDSADSSGMMRTDISGGGDYVAAPIDASSEKVKAATSGDEKPGELGYFTGNYTWYEVQLSLTVMRLWANFVRVGNPNGDLKSQMRSQIKGGSRTAQQTPLGNVETGTGGSHRNFGGGGGGISPGGHVHDVVGGEGGGEADFSGGGGPPDNRSGHKKKHQGSSMTDQQLPEPIAVEWLQYDSLDKKYLVLDLRPRMKSHYRSHKLSFWLHLVPDYQKNEEGTLITSMHHGLIFSNVSSKLHNDPHQPAANNNNNDPVQSSGENLSKVSVIPTVFASGLYDLSQGSQSSSSNVAHHQTRPHNSSSPNTPKLSPELPRGRIDHQQDPKEQQDSGETQISSSDDEEASTFGFQTYSTALSVTIAIGVSLLILNILIVATFYIERGKRLNALNRSHPSNSGGGSTSLMTTTSHPHLEHPLLVLQQKKRDQSLLPSTTSSPRLPQTSSSLGMRSATSTLRSLKRRKENGGVGFELGLQTTFSSCYVDMDMEQRPTFESSFPRNEHRCGGSGGGGGGCIGGTSGAFGDLHLPSSYETGDDDDDDEERRGRPAATSAPTGEREPGNYGNHPIKRYSDCGGGGGDRTCTIMSRNRSRRAINELGMSIDMSESDT